MGYDLRELDAGFKLIIESEMEKYRADTFWTKEPETIEWIKSFQNGGYFWDIGANIGTYSLFAAKIHPQLQVWAYEPQFLNYVRLVQNTGVNNFGNIVPLHMAFSRISGVIHFYVKDNEPGKSGGQLGQSIDEDGREFKPKEILPVMTLAVDDFLRHHMVPPPDYIKIDVDGHEASILWGMSLALSLDNLKSILIEFNQSANVKLLKEYICSFGFTADNEFNKLENHSRVRRAKENIKAENIVFTR